MDAGRRVERNQLIGRRRPRRPEIDAGRRRQIAVALPATTDETRMKRRSIWRRLERFDSPKLPPPPKKKKRASSRRSRISLQPQFSQCSLVINDVIMPKQPITI